MVENNRIDAHQHFWHYNLEDYGWINDQMPELKQDRLPNDLKPLLETYGFKGCIAVQARQTKEENDFLLSLSNRYPWILGVIGWLDLRADNLSKQLEDNSQYSKLKGYRHLIQDEKNPESYLADKLFNQGITKLIAQNKIYEVLIHNKDLAPAIKFCQRHDDGILILEHCGKPDIQNVSPQEWCKQIAPFRHLDHVSCKLSGLITEAGKNWHDADIDAFIDIALETFGPDRLLFGSDWPVCLIAASYEQVFKLIESKIDRLSASEQQAIWFANAQRIYKLN